MEKSKLNIQNKLLILILSGINYQKRRDTQLKTWLKDTHNIPYFFLMGENTMVENHCIYVPTPDSKLPEKLFLGYKVCFSNFDFDYLFTCDDDTYVVMERLLSSGYEKFEYMGTSYTFDEGDRKGLTHAEGGAGFFLSRSALSKITTCPLDDDLIQKAIASDTMVGDLAYKYGISLTHHNDFNQGWSMEKRPGEIPHPNNSAITSHYMNETQFKETYKAFNPQSMFLV